MNGEKKPNTMLRRERQLRGWSQQKVASLVETSEDVVSRWERGERKPGPFFQEKLCTLYGKSAEEPGFLVYDEEEDMKRRDANRTIAGLVSGILVTSSTGQIDPSLLAGLWTDDLLAIYARGIAACQDLYYNGSPHQVETILPLTRKITPSRCSTVQCSAGWLLGISEVFPPLFSPGGRKCCS